MRTWLRRKAEREKSMNQLVAPRFKPLQIRSVTLKNRVVMAPMTRGFSPGGIPGNDVAAYYRRRVEGETGLLITEGVGVDHPAALGDAGLNECNLPHMYGAEALAGWRRVVTGVHEAGGDIFPHAWDQGEMAKEGPGRPSDFHSFRPSGS